MDITMQHDALYPDFAVPIRRVGDVRNTPDGKQMFTGTGWVNCDGRTLLTVDYPVLFATLAYSFGGGGGQFKLPDLRTSSSQVHPESALPSRPGPIQDAQTERKTQQIIQRDGMVRTGYILQDETGRACIVHQCAVRWLSKHELWDIVHPRAADA